MTDQPNTPRQEPVVQKAVLDLGVDDYAHISIRREGRPNIDIDIQQLGLTVRSDGYYVASMLTDVKVLPHAGDTQLLDRFCGWCGEQLDLISSAPHTCKDGTTR